MTVAFIVKLELDPSDLGHISDIADDIQSALESDGFHVAEPPHAWAGETRGTPVAAPTMPTMQPLTGTVPQLHVPM